AGCAGVGGLRAPSFIPMPDLLAGRVLSFSLFGVPVLAVLAAWARRRVVKGDRLPSAIGGATLALLPVAALAGAVWSIAGDSLATTFFGPPAIVFPAMAHGSVAMSAAAVAMYVMIEVGWSALAVGRRLRARPMSVRLAQPAT